MKIMDMPYYNRPDYKLVNKGVNYLDDAELLAIILGSGNKEENAIELSNRLLKDYNLNKLDTLSFNELEKECKDKIKPLKIMSLIELSKRYNKLIRNGYTKTIKSAEDVFNIFHNKLANEKKEHFIVLYLDTRNSIIKEETISIGTLDSALIHPREVFKNAIKESAFSIILVHNHPSGDCTPSKEDIGITERLKEAGELLNIKVLDHVIIGKGKHWSYNENN